MEIISPIFFLFSFPSIVFSEYFVSIIPFRKPEAVVQDPAGVRDVREEVRLRDHDEAPPRHTHRGEALLLQGLWQAVHTERKS